MRFQVTSKLTCPVCSELGLTLTLCMCVFRARVNPNPVYVCVQRLPTTIGSLKKLQVLDLEENKLEFLPPEIGN